MHRDNFQPAHDRVMSTRQALPLLLERQRGLCARCGCKLLGYPGHELRLVPHPLAGLACECRECRESSTPELYPDLWPDPAGQPDVIRAAEVNHLVPKSAHGPNALSNYEATCGPCNLAHYAEWSKAQRAGAGS